MKTRHFLGGLFCCLSCFVLTGCQVSYILQSASGQFTLWKDRVPFSEALQDPNISEETKRKIRLTQETKKYAEDILGLAASKNYTDYVDLHRDHVTTVVSAAPAWKLVHYEWSFPFVGKVPYKGFFHEADAKTEEKELLAKGYDTEVRGVSAYSTLGYFRDALLSSMVRYEDHVLVNTLIHESVHTTLYISSSADFNERLASFVANHATEKFYREKEGESSSTLQKIRDENHDDALFSEFISQELKSLAAWYEQQTDHQENFRQAKFHEIQARFSRLIAPQLKTTNYSRFADRPLNNAKLLLLKTYVSNYDEFERVYQKHNGDIREFMKACVALKDSKDPDAALRAL